MHIPTTTNHTNELKATLNADVATSIPSWSSSLSVNLFSNFSLAWFCTNQPLSSSSNPKIVHSGRMYCPSAKIFSKISTTMRCHNTLIELLIKMDQFYWTYLLFSTLPLPQWRACHPFLRMLYISMKKGQLFFILMNGVWMIITMFHINQIFQTLKLTSSVTGVVEYRC